MKGEKKEMPKKIKNKKTRNETQKDDCLTCLSRWPSCHEDVGCPTSQNPRVQQSQRPTAAASLTASSCWPTAMPPHSFGSCSPLPLAYTWPLPSEADLSFPLFRPSLQKTADARSSCVSFPYVLPYNKIFGLPGFGHNCFIFEKEAHQMRGQNLYKTLFRRREGRRLPRKPRSRWKENIILK